MIWLSSLFNRQAFPQLITYSGLSAILVYMWILAYGTVTGDWNSIPPFYETAATWLTLVCVLLTNRQNMWCWPTGVISVLMFGHIFYEAQLYSSAVMNIVYYFPVQFWGWYQWMYGGKNRGERDPEWTASRVEQSLIFAGIGAGMTGWAYYLCEYTDAVSIIPDAAIFGISIVAQWITSYKRIEAWLLWIAVDIISTIVYWHNDLQMISSLYALFTLIAIHGAWAWWRDRERINNTADVRVQWIDRRTI